MEREVSVKICRQELIWYVSRVRYNRKLKIPNDPARSMKRHISTRLHPFLMTWSFQGQSTKAQLVADPNPNLKNRLRLAMNKF